MSTLPSERTMLRAYSETIRNGGGTYRLDGETPARGYCVGGATEALVIPLSEFAPWDVDLALMTVREAGHDTLGTWVDTRTGLVYLEGSNVLDNYDDAMALARERGELAIYDLSTGTEYRLDAVTTAA